MVTSPRVANVCNVITFSSNPLKYISCNSCSERVVLTILQHLYKNVLASFKPFHQPSESRNKNSGINYTWVEKHFLKTMTSDTLILSGGSENSRVWNSKAGNRSISSSWLLQISEENFIICNETKSDTFTQKKIWNYNFSSFKKFHFTKPTYLFLIPMVCLFFFF